MCVLNASEAHDHERLQPFRLRHIEARPRHAIAVTGFAAISASHIGNVGEALKGVLPATEVPALKHEQYMAVRLYFDSSHEYARWVRQDKKGHKPFKHTRG